MALTLDIGSNTREAVRGAKDVADAMEQISDSLDPLAKEGGKVGDKLADGMDEGRKAADKLERSFKETARELQRESKNAGDDIGRNIKDGADKAGDTFTKTGQTVREFGDEAKQNIGETFSSFRGDVEDFGQIAQDTLGGLAASFGGLPAIAATAAGAAGIGLVLQAITDQQTAVDELKRKFSDAYSTAAEEGRVFLDESQIQSDVRDLMFNPERAKEWKQVQEDAAVLGVSSTDLARARAGDEDELNRLTARGNELRDEAIAKNKDAGGALYETLIPLDQARGRLQDNGDILSENKAKAEEYTKAQVISAEKQRDANAATRDGGRALDENKAKVDAIPDSKTVKVNMDFTGAEAAISAFTRRERAAIQIGASVVGPTGKRVIA